MDKFVKTAKASANYFSLSAAKTTAAMVFQAAVGASLHTVIHKGASTFVILVLIFIAMLICRGQISS